MVKRIFALFAVLAGMQVAVAKDVAQWDNEDESEIKFASIAAAVEAVVEYNNDNYRTIVVISTCKADCGAAKITFSVNAGKTLTLEGGDWRNCTFTGEGTTIITGGTYDSDPSSWVANGYSVTESSGIWTVAEASGHEHQWKYDDGVAGSLTASCTNLNGNCVLSGQSFTLKLTCAGKVYNGEAVKATLQKKEFVDATGLSVGEVVYKQSGVALDTAPSAAGSYTAEVKAGDYTVAVAFEITPLEITELTLSTPTTFVYDGTDKHVSIASVKAGSLTLGENDYEVSGDATTQTGSLMETKTYTVTVNGTGNFTGSATATWEVTAPTGAFDDDALSTSASGCTADGNTVTVTDSTQLAYIAEKTWQVSAKIKFPVTLPKTSFNQDDPDVKYIDEAHALIDYEVGTATKDIKNKQYKAFVVFGNHNYIDSITWTVDIPLEDITAAIAEQKTELTYELSAGALAWTHYTTGIRAKTFTLALPLEGLVLLDEEGFQIYPVPEHEHVWDCSADGATLTATCGEDGCSIGTTNVTLKIDDSVYGAAPQATVENGLLGLARGLKVGEVGYTCPDYSDTEKWYTGDYTAVVTVTVNEVEYELTKKFKITKPEGGYENGYEVDSSEIRFDTIGEALANIGENDTIVVREDFNGETLDLSSDTDVTIDFGGKIITYEKPSEFLKDNSVSDLVIKNEGAGSVTLKNAKINQPVGYFYQVKSAKQIQMSGKLVFDEGVSTINRADEDRNELTITAKDGTLCIKNGVYQGKFLEDGGEFEIIGGDFAENPTEFLGTGYAIGVQKVDGYPFHVFGHVHDLRYVLGDDGVSISVVCDEATGHDECVFNSKVIKLVLIAEDAKKELENAPYKGASLDYDDEFPVRDCQITYWQDGVQLQETPFEVGEYVAKVELGGITAQKEFKILSRERKFDLDSIQLSAGATTGYEFAEGTLKMLDGTGWKYCAANDAPDGSNTEGWYATFTVVWPNDTLNYTRLAAAKFTMNGEKREFSGDASDIPGVEVKKSAGIISGFVWHVRVTPEELDAAAKAGALNYTRELTVWGETWYTTPITKDNDGVAPMTLKVTTSLENLTLCDGDGYLRYPLHDHEWNFEKTDDHTLKATCDVDGCRYHALPLTAALKLVNDDDGRLCNAEPMEAMLDDGDGNFASVTKATVGEIIYFDSVDNRLGAAPVQPGSYTAKIAISHDAASFEATLQLGFTIRAGEIVIGGKHYEGADTTTHFADAKKTYDIAFGKDFIADSTITAKGEKKLDLAGFGVVAPANAAFFTNEGTLTIFDSTFDQEGYISANPVSPEEPIITNEGTLYIESGIFLGTINNTENGVIVLSGGLYSVKPEKDWVAEGYDLVAYGTFWQIVPHEHTYQFLPFGPVLSATCSHIFVKGRIPQLSDCTAREMLMVMVAGSRGPIEYMGDSVQPAVYYVNVEALFKSIDKYGLKNLLKDLGVTDFFESFVTMIKQGIADGFNGGVDGGIANAILGGIRTEAEQKTIETILKGIVNKLIAPKKDDVFFNLFRPAFVTKEEYERITGAKVGEFVYTDIRGNVLNEAPKDVGTYVMSAKVQTQKGNTVTIWSRPYTIVPASLEEAVVICEPLDLSKPLVYTRTEQGVKVESVRLGGVLIGGYQSAKELIAAVRDGSLDLEGLSAIFKALNLGDLTVEAAELLGDILKKIGEAIVNSVVNILDSEKLAQIRQKLADDLTSDIQRLFNVFGGVELVADVDYEVNGTTNAVNVGEYCFSVDGIGNYKGSIVKNWSIVLATKEFGGKFADLTPVQGSGGWTFGTTVTYPTLLVSTQPNNARIQISTAPNTVFSGDDLNKTRENEQLTCELDGASKLKSVTWKITLTQEEIDELFDQGEETLTYTITAGAYAGEGNKDGYQDKAHEFTISLRDFISCKHEWTVVKTNDFTLVATCNNEACSRSTNAVVLAIGENGEREIVFDGLAHYAAPDGETIFRHFLPEADITYALTDADGNPIEGGAVEVSDVDRPYMGAATVVFGGQTYEIASPLTILSAREFGCSSLSEKVLVREGCGEVADKAFLLTKSQNLVYNAKDQRWHFAVQVKWPYNVEQIFHAPQFTAPEDAVYGIDKEDGVKFELVTDRFLRLKKLGFQEYVKALVCDIGLSVDELVAASESGKLVYTLKTGANTGSDDEDGLREAEFKIVIPITQKFELWRSICDYDVREFPVSEKQLLEVKASFADPVVEWTGFPVKAPALTVTYKGETLVENQDFVLRGEIAAIPVGYHRLSLVGIGDYEGVIIHDLEWEVRMMIVEDWAMKGVEYQGKTSGHVDSEDSSKFIVDKSENLELRDGKWYTGISIDWPRKIDFKIPKNSEVTDVTHATIKVTGRDDAFTAADWINQKVILTNQYVNIKTESITPPLRYMAGVDYMVAITREDVFALTNANPEATKIVYEITLSSDQWLLDKTGLAEKTFQIVVPLEGLKLEKHQLKCAKVELPNGCRRELVWRDAEITFFDGEIFYEGIPLVEGMDYIIEGVTEGREIGEYTLTLRGITNFEGELEYTFKIVEPRRPFAFGAMKPIDFNPTPRWECFDSRERFERERDFRPWEDHDRHGRRCPVDRRWQPYNPYANFGYFTNDNATTVFVVTNGDHLAYSLCGDKWYMGMTIDWPNFISPCDPLMTRLTGPWQARFALSTRPGVTNNVADIMLDDIFWFSNRLKGETMGSLVSLYRYPLDPLPVEYVDTLAWAPTIDVAALKAAQARGDEYVDFVLTAFSPAWACDPDGVRTTKFALRIPLNIVLHDWCVQRWPVHDHDWAFWVDDLRYMAFAECFAEGECEVPNQPLQVNFAAPSQSKIYDGKPFVQTLSGLTSYTNWTGAVVDTISYTNLAGGALLEGAPVEVGMYRAMTTVTVRPGTEKEKKLLIWTTLTIEPDLPTRPFGEEAMNPIPGRDPSVPIGEIDPTGRKLAITGSTNLVYDAESKTWYAGFTVDWPYDSGLEYKLGRDTYWVNPQFTDPSNAVVVCSEEIGELSFTTNEFTWVRGSGISWMNLGLTNAVTNVTWTIPITVKMVEDALKAGETEFVYTLTAKSDRWLGDNEGLIETTYEMTIPLEDLVLTDENGDQVWPLNWYNIVYKPGRDGLGEMESEKRLCGLRKPLTECAFTNTPLYLKGWSRNASSTVHFADCQFVKDPVLKGQTLTLTAVWTTKPVISGAITADVKSIASVTIVPVGKTVKDGIPASVYGSAPDFRYVAEFPSDGVYNIVTVVTEKDGSKTTITQLVRVDESQRDPETGKLPEAPVEHPEGKWSSTVDNSKTDEFVALVGGIEELVQHVITPDEKRNDDRVEMRFVLEKLPADDTTFGFTRITNEVRCACIKPLDLRLEKYVNGVYDHEYRDMTTPPDGSSSGEYNGYLEVVIPFRKEGRVNFQVVRYYEKEEGEPKTGSVDILAPLDSAPAKGHEGYILDETAGTITLYVSKFTTYALVWEGALIRLNDLSWEYSRGYSTWFGGLELECTNGWASSISDLQFVFERRTNDVGTVVAQLMSTSKQRLVNQPVIHDGQLYDSIDLPRGEGHFSVDGVEVASWAIVKGANKAIDVDQTIINVYQNFSADTSVTGPEDLFGWVTYTSYECTYWVPVGSNKGASDNAMAAILKSKQILTAPLSASALSATIAYNALSSGESDGCASIAEFDYTDGCVSGKICVGVDEATNVPGANIEAYLIGAKKLGDSYVDIAKIVLDENGRFTVRDVPRDYQFFKVRIRVINNCK